VQRRRRYRRRFYAGAEIGFTVQGAEPLPPEWGGDDDEQPFPGDFEEGDE